MPRAPKTCNVPFLANRCETRQLAAASRTPTSTSLGDVLCRFGTQLVFYAFSHVLYRPFHPASRQWRDLTSREGSDLHVTPRSPRRPLRRSCPLGAKRASCASHAHIYIRGRCAVLIRHATETLSRPPPGHFIRLAYTVWRRDLPSKEGSDPPPLHAARGCLVRALDWRV